MDIQKKVSRNGNGFFVVFEGPDGCGKTTQSKLVYDYLKNRYVLESGREPGTTVVGEGIRRILQDPAKGELFSLSEMLLFVAARSEYTAGLVVPALNSKKIYISDRFSDSTRAYQGYGLGLDLDLIDRLNAEATYNVKPDLTFIVDINVNDALENVKKQGKGLDKIERRGKPYFERVMKGYLETAKSEPERYRVVQYQKGNPSGMHEQIVSEINSALRGIDASRLIPMR